MTSYFLENLLLGKQLTDEQYADVPYPRMELHIHVLYKTVQAGCILGMGVIGPLVGLVRGRSLAAVRSAAYRGGRIGAIIGIPAGPLMTELTIKNAEQPAIYDRSFRIRHNVGQVRTDRFATYGALIGTGASLALGNGALPGLLVGFTAATVSAGVYNNAVAEKPAKSKSPEKTQ